MKTSSSPLVSVVIPVFNHQDYVRQALESVLNQTYSNLELIVIDDGSKDRSGDVVRDVLATWESKPQCRRSIQFIQQANMGAHATINKGLALSKGEWLTILNSDDYYDLKRIETILEKARHSKAKIAFSYVVGIDAHNNPLPSDHWWWRWYEKVRFNAFQTHPTLGFRLLQDNFAVSTGNLFFSRDLYQEVGPFNDLKLAHDLDFILRALVVAEPLLVRENHYFYRLHGHNTQYQVQHLLEKEFSEIHSRYLRAVATIPPKNTQAPCHWYWPSEFGRLRAQLKMERGLEVYLKKGDSPEPSKDTTKPSLQALQKGKEPITLISHEFSLSGAPKLVADLALSLQSHGYAPRVIGLTDGPMRLELERKGIPAYVLNRQSRIRELLSLLFLLCFRVRGKVIANSLMSWPFLMSLMLLCPWKRPVWYIHESFTPTGVLGGIRGRIANWLIKASKVFPLRLWFGSDGTRKAWTYTGLPKGDVMYWSGIPKQEKKRVKGGVPEKGSKLHSLLAVGTPSIRKGTHFLIKAFLKCLQENRIPKDTSLTIVGFLNSSHPTFVSLSDSILEAINSEFKDNFHFVTAVESHALEPFFQKADLFIQPSLQECLPLALLTAMSMGLPIITTDVDGCAEAIDDRKTGYVCAPFDIEGLANAIEEAVNHPEQSWEYGRQAQEMFNRKFSLEVTEKTLLNELIK